MALNLTELQAATEDYIVNHQPTDVFFKSHVLLFKLLKIGKTYNGGKKIQVNLEYDMTHAGSYGPKSELPISKKEIVNAAFFPYAAYFSALTMDMDDELINSGDLAIVNLLVTKMKNAEKSIRYVMGKEIYESRATNMAANPLSLPFIGLADLFEQSDSVAFGEILPPDISPSTWKAGYISGEKTMGFKFMQELRRAATIDNNNEGQPDLYLTTSVLKDAFARTIQAQVRYTSKDLAEAGFSNVLFEGVPVTSDDRQTAGYVDALNTQYLDVYNHSRRNFTKPEWKSPIQQPDTATANIRWAGQFVCKRRDAHARAINVVEPA
jgi:hypothetical protein